MLNLYYLKQGNKGFIKDIQYKGARVINKIRGANVNGLPIIKVGDNYMFNFVDGAEQVISFNTQESDTDFSPVDTDLDTTLTLVELGTITSGGNIVISENLNLEELEDFTVSANYRNIPIVKTTALKPITEISIEDLDVYYVSKKAQEALVIAYLKSKADADPKLSFEYVESYNKEFTLKIIEVQDFETLREQVLTGSTIKSEDVVTKHYNLYRSQHNKFESAMFYSKNSVENFINSLLASTDSEINAHLRFMEKEVH